MNRLQFFIMGFFVAVTISTVQTNAMGLASCIPPKNFVNITDLANPQAWYNMSFYFMSTIAELPKENPKKEYVSIRYADKKHAGKKWSKFKGKKTNTAPRVQRGNNAAYDQAVPTTSVTCSAQSTAPSKKNDRNTFLVQDQLEAIKENEARQNVICDAAAVGLEIDFNVVDTAMGKRIVESYKKIVES